MFASPFFFDDSTERLLRQRELKRRQRQEQQRREQLERQYLEQQRQHREDLERQYIEQRQQQQRRRQARRQRPLSAQEALWAEMMGIPYEVEQPHVRRASPKKQRKQRHQSPEELEAQQRALEATAATRIQSAVRGHLVRRASLLPSLRKFDEVRTDADRLLEQYRERRTERQGVLELEEALLRLEMRVDGVAVNGNALLRSRRKSLIVALDGALAEVDRLKIQLEEAKEEAVEEIADNHDEIAEEEDPVDEDGDVVFKDVGVQTAPMRLRRFTSM